MEIISIFESALEENNWEKLFRARSMMLAFWYNKWERFEWAIIRAMESLDEEKRKNNFFPVEIKSTGWRPWRDFLITRWGCYILLKFCDGRKSEVQVLKKYLEKLYLNSKIQTQKVWVKKQVPNIKNFFTKEIFFLIGLLWIFLLTLAYYASFFEFLQNPKHQFYVPQERITQEDKTKLEEKYIEIDKKTLLSDEEKEIVSFQDTLAEHIEKWPSRLVALNPKQNPRTDFTKEISWVDLILSYFEFWNKWFFDQSCSLLEKSDCNALSKNLNSFANFWKKTSTWHQILDVSKKSEGKYCVKYKYNLKTDYSDNFITETFQYQTNFVNGVEQITGRFCEKIEKNGRERPCPFVLKEYVCEE